MNRDVTNGLKQGVLIGAAVLVLVVPHVRHHEAPHQLSSNLLPPPAAVAAAPAAPAAKMLPVVAEPSMAPAPLLARRLELGTETAPRDVKRLAQWVVDSADNGLMHFVILDKKNARVFVFDPSGKLAGASPVLLGFAAGDDTVPGIGNKPIAEVQPQERTTPAGRFVAERGRNALQEDVIWVDYDAAVSMHRVRATNPAERRLERLASRTASDNRISFGCINMPVPFFEGVVWPLFQYQRGVVYVMPEIKPLTQVFPGLKTPYHMA